MPGKDSESNSFFAKPILNSPYEYPGTHCKLDETGQPTQQEIHARRVASFITPVNWKVTPETSRLLQHWCGDHFSSIRPFFCQVKAAEVVIWLTEVAPSLENETTNRFLDHIYSANESANPGLSRLACKLATGEGKTTVMAMLIAMQTINWVRRKTSGRFTSGFLMVEIKGYRGEDAREKGNTMETSWVPGANNLGSYGRWNFAEFTEVFQIKADFEQQVAGRFDQMVDTAIRSQPSVSESVQ